MPAPTESRNGDATSNAAAKLEKTAKRCLKLKKTVSKLSKPGNWQDGGFEDDKKNKKKAVSPTQPLSSPGLPVNQVPESVINTFSTARPLEDNLSVQKCKHCNKSILKKMPKDHITQCIRLKKEKAKRKKEARRAIAGTSTGASASAGPGAGAESGDFNRADSYSEADDDGLPEPKSVNGVSKTSKKANANMKKAEVEVEKKDKKRKAEVEAERPPKLKKKKDEPKAKIPKLRGPVDVEKQCGVLLPNGAPCARSLTCKSHSMGAKRAVAGRTLPYDMLLAAYQKKKNQAKHHKVTIDTSLVLNDDDDNNVAQVDSDEETAAVMSALASWNPQPVIPQPVFNPIKRQYGLLRLHEQLQIATNSGRTNIFRVVGFSASPGLPSAPSAGLLDAEDAPGEPDSAVSAYAPVGGTASFSMPEQARRVSITGRA